MLLAAAAVAAAATSFLAGIAPANASPVSLPSYVKAVHTCTAAKPGQASCDAVKLVPSTKGAPGARPASTRGTATVPAALTGPAGGYTPAALAKAYGVTPSTATTLTVGIVDAQSDPNVRADLSKFDAKYGLPAETTTSLKVVNQRGAASPLPTADAGWAGEISLDVDAVRGLCNKCKIVLVETDSPSFTDLAAGVNEAVALGAKIVTNSYGGAESGAVPTTISSAYKHSGVVITASTGDDGYFDWDNVNTGGSSSEAPAIPAAFGTVVAVGGTTLNLNDDGTRASESVWNSNGPFDVYGNSISGLGASGGGCSTLFAAPSWQKAVANYAVTGCGTKRMVGDVSALADPFTGYDVYDSYQTSTPWATFGGTSLASPLTAAIWALAGGAAGVASPAQTLYANFAAGGKVYDVKVGGNGACGGASTTACASFFGGSPNAFGAGTLDCAWKKDSATLASTNGACNAKVGYDGPSGVGAPIGIATFKKV